MTVHPFPDPRVPRREVQPPLQPPGGDGTSGGMEGRIAALEAHVAHIREDVSGLKADVRTLQTDVGSIKTDVATLKEKVSHLPSKDYIFKVVGGIGAAIVILNAVAPALLKALGISGH